MYSLNTKDRNIVSLFQRARKNIIIKNIVLSLSLTLASFFVSEKYVYAQESKVAALSYSVSDLEIRLSTYTFVDPDLTLPFPVEWSTIAKLLTNFREAKVLWFKDSDEYTAAFSFIRDDAIFLITILRLEKELQKLQTIYHETLSETTVFSDHEDLKTHLKSLLTIVKDINSIWTNSKHPRSSSLSQLQIQKKTLETDIANMITKRNARIQVLKNKIEIACKWYRDLLIIIWKLSERLHVLHVGYFSQGEKDIIQQDITITQDAYHRIYTLFKETFRKEVEMSTLQLPLLKE